MSYHLAKIIKGTLGKASKIEEEFWEFEDALAQNNPVMAVQELSDLIGAIEAYIANYGLTLENLITMNEATKRAFKSGHRE